MQDPTTNLAHSSGARSAAPMLWIGGSCHRKDCHREDFLPFKCKDCSEQYCSEHFRPSQHSCPAATSSGQRDSSDYYVPLCPVCHEPPQGWRRDEDPNIAMERHLSLPAGSRGACKALDAQGRLLDSYVASGAASTSGSGGEASGRSTPQQPRQKGEKECRYRKCRKIMVVPIVCQQCKTSFCPSHRAPVQHECASLGSGSGGKNASSSSSNSLLAAGKGTTGGKTNGKDAGAGSKPLLGLKSKISALKPTSDNSSTSGTAKPAPAPLLSPPTSSSTTAAKGSNSEETTSKSTSTSKNGSSPFNLFDKTDKRARAEAKSAIRAMQERHKRGLLTKTEETRLAELMAQMHVKGGIDKDGEKDCVVC